MSLRERIRQWRHDLGVDISTPQARRRAQLHFDWFDHGILRKWWKNFHKIDEGVYRSNQPSPQRLAEFRDMGIKTILNLRGSAQHSQYLFESEACAKLGLELIDFRLCASDPPSREELFQLFEIFRTMQRPVVMHCKSGADRTGFAAVLYLHVIKGVPLEQAMKQLHWRYVHFRRSKNGILDLFFEVFLEESAKSGITFQDWIRDSYNREALRQRFSRHFGLR